MSLSDFLGSERRKSVVMGLVFLPWVAVVLFTAGTWATLNFLAYVLMVSAVGYFLVNLALPADARTEAFMLAPAAGILVISALTAFWVRLGLPLIWVSVPWLGLAACGVVCAWKDRSLWVKGTVTYGGALVLLSVLICGLYFHISGRRRRIIPTSSPLAKFSQELIRRHKERILLKDATDDNHGMGSHDVNDRVTSKTTEMVSTDDRVVVTKPHVVYTRLELNHVIDMGSIFNRPVHTATNAAQGKSSLDVSAGQLLEHLQHPILIEAAIWKVNFGVDSKVQLPALLGRRQVDACRSQAL